MIQTPIGLFLIKKNENEIIYKETELSSKFNDFQVDKRYQIEFEYNEKNIVVDFILETQFSIGEEDLDSDEDLFYAVYNYNNLIIGIGIEGDIYGIKYEYIKKENKYGIKLIITDSCIKNSIKINVSWMKVINYDQIVNIQLAIDPGYYV
jgi:hypothetical protein